MITLDTGIVLRYLLQDDSRQSQKASMLFEGAEKVLLTDVVLVEVIWTLQGKRYQLSKEALVGVLYSLIGEANVVFEDAQAVWCALDDYISARPIEVGGKSRQANFADALIVNKSLRQRIKGGSPVGPLYTFDKATLAIEGAQEPESNNVEDEK